jgi:hypothetical protein
MASRASIEGLYEEITRNRVRSESGRYFIQPSKVRGIFTLAKIDHVVAEHIRDAHERVGLAEKIWKEGTILFAILVWMKEADSIVRFRNHECLDDKLPVDEARALEIVPTFGRAFAREYQWQFLPYLFKRDMCNYHRRIDQVGVIFPFVGNVEPVAEGGFGTVSKLTIPTSLQEFFYSEVRGDIPRR